MIRKKLCSSLLLSAMLCGMAVMPAIAEDHLVEITLSDSSVLVDGAEISEDASAAVYAGAEIVYYQAGQGETYGAGSESEEHSEEDAAAQTVITITQPGTYKVTGSIGKGQIAIDLGEDSRENSEAVVNLILDNAEITCDVAPGIVVYNAYECGSDDTETAVKDVDTAEAGFNLILADDSENVVNGSHVAKIYKDGTTQEDVDAGEAKKKWKFDAAVDSLVSMNIQGQDTGNGKLTVNADNEGISSGLHMTVNSGEIVINASDDSINTNEDNVSVFTMNGGSLTCDSGSGAEGDGIDSNGWIVINGGTIVSGANASSQDSGVDSDLGIYINGGTVLASGNMYDQVAADSAQPFMVFSFAEQVAEDEIILLKDSEGNAVTAFTPVNSCQTIVYSSDLIADGDYTLYKASSVTGDLKDGMYTNITEYTEEVQLQYGGGGMMNFGGGQMGGKMDGQMNDQEMPENFEPGQMDGQKMPENFEPDQMDGQEMPENFDPGQMNGQEMPENFDPGQRDDQDAPEMPKGMEKSDNGNMGQRGARGGEGRGEMAGNAESNTIFTVNGVSNLFSQISQAAEAEETESVVA